MLGLAAVDENEQVTAGYMFTGANPNVQLRLESFSHSEVWDLTRTARHRHLTDADIVRENQDRLIVCIINGDIILRITEGSILLTVMLITAKSLEYYKDQQQMKTLGKKLTELLKTLRKENNLDSSDFDGINVHISEEDLQKADAFFRIGKYRNRWRNTGRI